MRWFIPLGVLAALAFAQTAQAAPVSVADVAIAPTFQDTLHKKLGDREGEILQDRVAREVSRALQRAGADVTSGAGVRVETTIVDADPNRPTLKELGDTPGLSMLGSISTGGAHLTGVIRNADGSVVAEVDHRQYSASLFDVLPGAGEWQDADRSIRQYARKVAAAYVANVR